MMASQSKTLIGGPLDGLEVAVWLDDDGLPLKKHHVEPTLRGSVVYIRRTDGQYVYDAARTAELRKELQNPA